MWRRLLLLILIEGRTAVGGLVAVFQQWSSPSGLRALCRGFGVCGWVGVDGALKADSERDGLGKVERSLVGDVSVREWEIII